MRLPLFFFFLVVTTVAIRAQTAPRFIKTDIGDSGCKIYLPGKADPVGVSFSPDSSLVYTIETLDSTTGAYYHFGSVLVNLNNVDLEGQEEDVLVAYMDYLKTAFKIEEAVGYGKGHSLSTHSSAKGVLDYWKDSGGDQWAVKGWAAESTIFVMFVYGPGEYPNSNIVDVFFKGARFKGDE